MEAGDLGEDAVVLQEGDDDELAEDGEVHFVEGVPFLLEEEAGFGAGEVDAEHEAFAADFGDEGVLAADFPEAGHGVVAHGGGVFDEFFVFDDVERGECRGHGEVVLAVGVAVDDAAFHGVEGGFHDVGSGDDGTDGDHAAGEGFGDAEDVGVHTFKMMEGEPFAGAAEAALDFIEDEERAGGAAEALGFAQVIAGEDFARFPLDGFDDEGGGVFGGEGALEGGEVVEGDFERAGDGVAEFFAEEVGAVDGEGAGGEAVEGVVAVDDFLAACVGAGELEGAFDGFCAGVGEEDAGEVVGGVGAEFLCDEAGEEGAIHADEVGEVGAHGLFDDGADLGVVAAECEDAPAGEEVEVFVVVLVEEVGALAAGVGFVEADGAEHFHEGGVDVLVVEVVLLAGVLGEPVGEVGVKVGHAARLLHWEERVDR